MKGYKAFESDWTCRGFQYEIGKTYNLAEGEELEICKCGFHFCANPIDVFGYYPMDGKTKIAVIEALGNIEQEGTKFCTDKIRIIKEFTLEELQALILDGSWNSGNYNSGLFNSGSHNSGNYNSGNYNSGGWNSGNHNSGNNNSGNRNSGDFNSGNGNSGNGNSGKQNSGNRNSGDFNSGSHNSGNYNLGDNNLGDNNLGDCNSGNSNIGYGNDGDCNSGSYNSGNYNSGCFNSGSHNSGNYNSGNYNSGMFNTNEPKMRLFNKLSDLTFSEFISNLDYNFTELCIRINKKDLRPEDYVRIKALPNFDADIFEEITGIKIE